MFICLIKENLTICKIKLLTFHRAELNGDERLQVAFGVLEREVAAEEALLTAQAVVLDDRMQAEVLNVRRIFTLARHPDDFQTLSGAVALLDVTLQRLGHLRWQLVLLLVVFRLPVEDLVELEEDAWTTFLVLVFVLRGARFEGRQVDLARLTIGWISGTAVDGVVRSLRKV